ncbi:Mov34-domain-containing protein [Microthyrium microscopicum]|uniref:Eukaryotic translation initiation factor 3 subunit F n=1 Tax=Microthyrium microscopicum TaxID=703497 RepID=A0A6A6UNL5_9PEZI|nr:Mov34-domain-containing protein [Microthyrium microscopicum]
MAGSSFLHVARPLPGVGPQPTTAPLNVSIQPQALFSVIDHSLRRDQETKRVIGTLLGTRSEDGSDVDIRAAYAVPHTETDEQVEVDMDYQKQMLALHLKANPREVLVGWYATSAELNTFSALIQNFYAGQPEGTWPYPAVHLTVDTTPAAGIAMQTYIGVPIGVTEERSQDSCSFIPVPHQVKYTDADRSGLELISSAKDSDTRAALVGTDLDALEGAIEKVLDMLDRVSNYVSNVLDEEAEPSTALGQYLMNTLSLAPKVDPANIERDFNNHIQDVLVVSYLANTIRTQIDLSNRLATAALTIGGGEVTGENQGGERQGGDNRRGGKGGRGGRGGQNRQQQREPREPTES